MEKNEFLEIKKSLGNDFPPRFIKHDNSRFRNCYSHALNLWFESPETGKGLIYVPGCITALAQNSDMMREDGEEIVRNLLSEPKTFTCYDVDLLIKLIKRDCDNLGLVASLSSLEKPSKENSYKIILCAKHNLKHGWHMLRESISEDGKRIWTHKLGFDKPASQVELVFAKKNSIYLPNILSGTTEYFIKAVLEISKKS